MPVGKVRFKGYRGEVLELYPEQALNEAALDPWFPWPYAMLHAILYPKARPTEGYSITTLEQGCPRCVVLQAKEEYTLDLNRNWKRFRGTSQHYIMEDHAPKGGVTEPRFYAELDGSLVHGSIDLLLLNTKAKSFVIQDYKFPDDVPNWDRVWPDHEAQVNGYRWLVNNADVYYAEVDGAGLSLSYPNLWKEWECRSLGIIYVGQKGPKPLECRVTEKVRTKAGAKNEWKSVKRPAIWTDEEVEAFFIPRLRRLREAFEHYDKHGTLPDYPEGFDPFSAGGLHSYSDTVQLCLERWKEGR